MKKSKFKEEPRRDPRRPAKPAPLPKGKRPGATASEVTRPSYEGPAKTSRMPKSEASPGRPTKAGFPASTARSPRATASDLPGGDQVAKSTPKSTKVAAGGEQYVRLRVRVSGDRLSIIDSHLVDGPLGQAQRFSGPHVYEVTVADRLLHAGSLPDIGVQRSFVNPSGPPEQRGHFITERPLFEFMARVPAHEVTPAAIGKMAVRVHRLKDEVRTERLSLTPLSRQFERQTRQLAELVGLPPSILPAEIEKRGGRTPSLA